MQLHYDMLQKVSRTFALSIEQLTSPLRDAATLAYLLFRVSDCLEDHDSLSVPRKIELLDVWARILAGELQVQALTNQIKDLDDNDPEVFVAQKAGEILAQLAELPQEAQSLILTHAYATTVGMARWQAHGPFVENEAALDDYMHEVAGRVGYLLTELFAWYWPSIRARKSTLMPLSRESGLALQTVNIIRGMRKDYERGWVFVPESFLTRVGLTRDSLFDVQNLDKGLLIIDMLAEKAAHHLENGFLFLLALPKHRHAIRLACMWPFFFAVRTLAISRDNPNVLLNEAKISRADVKDIIIKTKLFGWSNVWLKHYYQTLGDVKTRA
ncbi:MAG: squalene/phytoene synthase family protein [Anaerolineae bacterium]|nr:squalene/phytoene synthase family protein [Anaerolineae bacterium]